MTRIVGAVPTQGDLPEVGEQQGDAYIVEATSHLWVWTESDGWVDLGTVAQGPPGTDATVTDASVASALEGSLSSAQIAAQVDARTGNGERPVGRGEVVINASHHSILPTNTAEQNAAALAALVAAANTFFSSRTILLDRPGDYLHSGQLEVPGVTLRGLGKARTRIKATTGSNFQGLVKITAAGAALEDLTVDGNSAAYWGVWATSSADDHRLSNVHITGAKDHGVHADGSPRPVYTNVTASGNGFGVVGGHGAGFYMIGAPDPQFIGCWAGDNFEHGYYLRSGDASGLMMTACRATGNGQVGITARYNRQTLNGCYSWGNGTGSLGIWPTYQGPEGPGSGTVVSGGIFGGSLSPTQGEDASVSVSNDVTLSGCYFETTNALTALRILNSSRVDLTGVTARQRRAAGAVAPLRMDNSSGVTVNGGSIINAPSTAASGIYVSGCTDVVLNPSRIDLAVNGIFLTGNNYNVSISPNIAFRGIANQHVNDSGAGGARKNGAPVSFGAALPTRGTFEQGELVMNSSAAAGQPAGWVCTYRGAASEATWAASTAYAKGQWVAGPSNTVREVMVAGTTGTTMPAYGAGPAGTTVTDGTVTWFTHTYNKVTFLPLPNL